MSVVPGSIETDTQPPMAVPLRHFVVGLGLLVAGGLAGLASQAGVLGGLVGIVHVHLLLAGWVCVTIMGAMTQFVPVWSGVDLYDRRLAAIQLWAVLVGLVGFALSLLAAWLVLVPVFGLLMAVGFWAFVYNVGRTLARVESLDVTERHFVATLAFFGLLTVLGVALAVDLAHPVFVSLPVTRVDVVGAHATLAVFGAVLTTVLGAIYQLATMFTQTDLQGVDHHLQRVETVGYPVGVVLLAGGRLLALPTVARVGGVLVLVGLASVSVVLARRLAASQVPRTPMLARYAVAAGAMALWAVLAVPAWLERPLASVTRFGAPGTSHLLTLGAVGFVVLGTLYHVVPFIVWVHRYSDRLGYEAVPMIDDLYSSRLATVDFLLFLAGTALLVAGDLVGLATPAGAVGGTLVLAGSVVFAWNVLAVIRRHSPHTLPGVLVPRLDRSGNRTEGTGEEPADGA